LRTLFTRVDAARANMRSAGYGSSSERACSFEIAGSSHSASETGRRMAGMRSCTATSSFGVVVMIVQLAMISPVSASVREVHRPANEQPVAGQVEVDGLLLAVAAEGPLVEAVCRDQAAVSVEEAPVRGLLG
jgi:hypothetical protein